MRRAIQPLKAVPKGPGLCRLGSAQEQYRPGPPRQQAPRQQEQRRAANAASHQEDFSALLGLAKAAA